MSSSNHFLAQLLQSGEYSDFTLLCEGQRFPLHRAVVCPQSPVINAAINGAFKESATKKLVVENFDVQTLKRFIAYLYKGKYENEEDNDEEHIKEEDDTELSLKYHLEMHKIADYYGVATLKDLSYEKIQTLLWKCGMPESFVELLKDTEVLRDKKLTTAFAAKAATNIQSLIKMDEFSELTKDSMALNIIKTCAKKMANQADQAKILRASLYEQETKLRIAQKQLQSARDSFNDCVEVLRKWAFCRHCGENFSCYIEKGGADTFTLRCADCTTRHK